MIRNRPPHRYPNLRNTALQRRRREQFSIHWATWALVMGICRLNGCIQAVITNFLFPDTWKKGTLLEASLNPQNPILSAESRQDAMFSKTSHLKSSRGLPINYRSPFRPGRQSQEGIRSRSLSWDGESQCATATVGMQGAIVCCKKI